ncbi:MAG: hypothetical protein CMJ81_24165 [Planctomycetaceae bacterium]|nr:hypothetical protein [Planctomycetaceae bacterium]MBP62039.1 hypothetical protein [Planctomycetaceae bacterium]
MQFGYQNLKYAASTVSVLLLTTTWIVPSGAQNTSFGFLGGVHLNNIQLRADAAIGDIPISGFIPRVAVSLTNERTSEDTDFFAQDSSSPAANTTLPGGQAPYYTLALLDSGAQTHVLRNKALGSGSFNLVGANLEGGNATQLVGAAGSEFGINTDALGIYAAGLSSVTSDSPIVVEPNALDGQINVSVVILDNPGSLIPDVLGTPFMAQRTTVIRNDHLQEVTFEGETYTSPNIEFLPLGTTGLPNVVRHAPMSLYPGDRFLSQPIFFPGIDILNFDLKNDPLLPSASGNFYLSVDLANDNFGLDNEMLFFDTGAEVSVISRLTAINLGFDAVLDTPDFTVDVDGAGGTLTDIPGIYIDSLNIDTVGGTFTLSDVPVIVFDIADPRDGVNLVPGIIGTNLFVDRNLEINPAVRGAYLAISDPLLPGDFNASGNYDSQDIDLLSEQLSNTSPPRHSRYDLVADGVIDSSDVDQLVVDLMGKQYGDTNLDQRIDITDYSTLAFNFDPLGLDLTWAQGDFNGDHQIDLLDYNVLATHFSPGGYAAATVPEPATSFLTACALSALGTLPWLRRPGPRLI